MVSNARVRKVLREADVDLHDLVARHSSTVLPGGTATFPIATLPSIEIFVYSSKCHFHQLPMLRVFFSVVEALFDLKRGGEHLSSLSSSAQMTDEFVWS